VRAIELAEDSTPAEAEARAPVISEIDDHFEGTIPSHLETLRPGIIVMWDGAWQAIRSSNPDKVRHALTSARELLNHVLHALAPDDEVATWSTSPKDFVAKKPTISARLRYIFSTVSFGPIGTFLEADCNAAIELYALLNRGTHEILPAISVEQSRILLRKIHGVICTLCEAKRGLL